MRIERWLIVLLMASCVPLQAGELYSPLNKSVLELSTDMQKGTTSALELTRFYLQRIEQFNPTYRAVISTNPKAEEIAAGLDAVRAEGRILGPLHGIPVLLKDNINTIDPMPTTAGSLALKQNFALEDAPLVKSLRAAGAIIIGKTNLSEWANMRSSRSISGWTAIGGFTLNAWDTDKNPCGSSSGSAVAAALNFAPLTVGSETDGSILCPASKNGVVGFKPGAGTVSQQGIVPISHTQDTAGPITRSVTDAVILLQGMLAADAVVNPAVLQAALSNGSVKGLKVGVARVYTGYDAAVDEVFEGALKTLKKAGAELLEIKDPMMIQQLGPLEMFRLLAEIKADMQAYLEHAPKAVTVRTMADLIAFNKTNKDKEMPYFGQELFIAAEQSSSLDSKAYQENEKKIQALLAKHGIEAILERHQLDLLVAPTYGVAGLLKQERKSATPIQPGSTQLSAMAGLPVITVPMGTIVGLPLGLSFMAGKYSEPVLIRAALAFEKMRGEFPVPTIIK